MAGVVLAAGRAARFGGAKLLAPLHGRPLATHTLATARQARADGLLDDVIAVVPAEDARLAALAAASGARTIANDAPERGLSHSLQLGLAAVGGSAGAAVILLADQPCVRREVLAALIAGWRARRGVVIRPRYAEAPDEPGHPVLLDRSVWPHALALDGDQGVGRLFPPGAAGVTVIDVPGRNPDVDTPDDLLTLEGPTS